MTSSAVLRASGIVAVLGGLLMFLGGVTSHSVLLWILPMLQQQVMTTLSGPTQAAASVAVYVVALLVSLGGITVALGGVSLLIKHRSVGRTLIALGGGAGVVGLAIALGYTALVNGFGSVGDHAGYWVGVALAVVARRLTKS